MSFREINFAEDVGLDEVTVRTPVNIATIKYWGLYLSLLHLLVYFIENFTKFIFLNMNSIITQLLLH